MTPRPSPSSGALKLQGDGRPTVVLRHDLPDGSHHFDWLLATDTAGEAPLTTFRLPRNLDSAGAGKAIAALRLPDHRAVYLQYEGPVDGNRGSVRQLLDGRITAAHRSSESGSEQWRIAVEWRHGGRSGPAQQILRLKHVIADGWSVEMLDVSPAEPDEDGPGEVVNDGDRRRPALVHDSG